MTRHIIIGDVHGCIEELNELLERLELRLSDRLIFVGDLIDKGPDSLGVLRRVRALREVYDVEIVLGNHEEKLCRYWKHLREGRTEVAEGMVERKPELAQMTVDFDAADAALLQSMSMYCLVPRGVVVHAGIPPALRRLPSRDEYERARGEDKKLFEQMLRLRRIRPDGGFVAIGDDTEGTDFWAERYTGMYGTVFFGHEAFMEQHPVVFPHAIGLDLGCCYGGYLAAAVLDDERYGIRFVSVMAHDVYSQRHHED